MARLKLSLFATFLVLGSSLGVYAYSKVSDTPECCQKQESCCPNSSCCTGGKNGQCPLMHHRA
jgi:hypothetical protein